MSTPIAPELREAALSGARWTALGRLVAEIAAFGSSIVLARLVAPAEFGHAAVALIVVGLAAVLGTAGLTAPIVQRRELGREHVASTAFLTLAGGALLAVLSALFGLALAPGLFGEETANLVVQAAPAWLIVGIGATSQALLQRDLRFRRQAEIEAAAVIAGVFTSLALALAGLGGEALVAGALAVVAFTSLLSFVSAPPGRPRPTRRGVDDVWRLGAPVAASSLVYLGYKNADYAILGARTSPEQVGFYWRAYQLGVGYQSKVSRVMLRISFPLYSRARSQAEMRELHTRIVRAHGTVIVPLLAAFVGVAPVLVPWLFGPDWEEAVLPAQILTVAGAAEALTTSVGPLMVALARPRALTVFNLVLFGLYVVLIALLAPFGVIAVAIGVAAFAPVTVVAAQLFLFRPFLGLGLHDLWMDVRPGLVSGASVLVALLVVRQVLGPADLAVPLLLAILGATGLVVYSAALRSFFPTEWGYVVQITRRRAL